MEQRHMRILEALIPSFFTQVWDSLALLLRMKQDTSFGHVMNTQVNVVPVVLAALYLRDPMFKTEIANLAIRHQFHV